MCTSTVLEHQNVVDNDRYIQYVLGFNLPLRCENVNVLIWKLVIGRKLIS